MNGCSRTRMILLSHLAEKQQEWNMLERRVVTIVHDLNMGRTARNQGLRDRVWKALTPRALRLRELQAKKELGSSETAELETLCVWFKELQTEACRNG